MTSTETRRAKSRLKVLSSSLDEVEAAIAPLLSGKQTLPEILLSLEPLNQAKLQTVLPYLVYDLLFIYLRTRGIDPKSHPVVAELERVRQYFEKIKDAENPAIRGTQVDKAAANRFIKHAISQAQIDADAAGVTYPPKASSSAVPSSAVVNPSDSSPVHVPIKLTSKMLERQEWQKRVDEAGSEEEEDLEGWDDDGDDDNNNSQGKEKTKFDSKGKGKAVEVPEFVEQLGNKRRRPAIDPFAASGYDDSDNPLDSHLTKKQALAPDASFTVDPSSTSTNTTPATKAEKKNRKKQKAKELKAPDRASRVASLLAKVAASQGVMFSSSSSAEYKDVEMVEAPSTPETLAISSEAGDKKNKKGKRKKSLSGLSNV
ncbi:Sas10/Utp3/C1D family-domain-containing protein [Lentinula aciculospora]|uniref:Exosome complex protein n=1 Tax=Lentinula aciculospora TaxID=153920 RepID=A0A9W9DU70_9AGAR|nr:Sas10/Utp3/C1D family-domain-containing protein [Lentinula aciculospora]